MFTHQAGDVMICSAHAEILLVTSLRALGFINIFNDACVYPKTQQMTVEEIILPGLKL